MFQITKELILPVLLVIIPVISLQLQNLKLKKKNEQLIEKVEDVSLSLEMDLVLLNSIQEIASKILMSTNAERFLILTATNGQRDLRFANAIYEHHDTNPKINLSVGATGKYVKFEFDSHYKEMLKQAEMFGFVNYDVNAMVDCDLKFIYDSENITFSNVFFLIRSKIDESNDRMFYCSIATHQDKPFTPAETIIMKSQLSRLRLKMQSLI
jgi:hypothetical protein